MKRKRAIQTITERLQANLLIGLFLSLSVICMATPQDSIPIISSDSYSTGRAADIPLFLREEPLPEFPGGEEHLQLFIQKNIRYPKVAHENGIEGTVVCKFQVNRDGSIVDIQIVKRSAKSLEKEVLRVMELMPKWSPGSPRGRHYQLRFEIPFIFKLNYKENEE